MYGFDSAMVLLEMDELSLAGEEKEALRLFLTKCVALEVLPMPNGRVRMGVTLKGVLNKKSVEENFGDFSHRFCL